MVQDWKIIILRNNPFDFLMKVGHVNNYFPLISDKTLTAKIAPFAFKKVYQRSKKFWWDLLTLK